MKACVILALTAVAACSTVSTVAAQPPAGVPTAPPVPGTQDPPADTGIEDAQRRADRADPATWGVSLSYGEGYESDVSFGGAQGNSDWGRMLTGRLAKTWMRPRGTVEISGNGTQSSYRRASDVNRFTYGINGGASYALTRRLSWRFGGTFNEMYSQDAQMLTEAGLVFPRVVTRTSGTYSELGYMLSAKNQLNVNVSTMRVEFLESPLLPGSSLAARMAFSRQLNRSQSLGVSFGHTISTITGDIQGLFGTWQARAGSKLVLNAAGGVRPYKLDGASTGYRFSPGGSLGFALALARNQSAGFSYERAVEQAFGFGGTHLAHRYNGFYTLAVGRRLSLDGGASVGINSYPQRAGYLTRGRTFTAGARYLLVSRLSVGATYGLWSREETGTPSSSTYRFSISAAYGFAWR